MKAYIIGFTKAHNYPAEAVEVLLDSFNKVSDKEDFLNLVSTFYAENPESKEYFEPSLDQMAKKYSCHRYTLYLLYLICISKELKEKYAQKGVGEDVFFDTMKDLRCKLFECFETDKVWGVIPFADWFYSMFHMNIFALGRMEYNYGPFRGESATVAGIEVKEGDMVLHIHIPSSGEPFDRTARIASYEKAYNFYLDAFGGKTPVFCCDSWLLNPENKEVLGEKSNIASFVDDFKIIDFKRFPDNRNMWRIFGADADLPPEQLPRKTSMQRKIADWIAQGNRLGSGKGLFVFDPQNKITVK